MIHRTCERKDELFDKIILWHISRLENLVADALAQLASSSKAAQVVVSREVLDHPSIPSTRVNTVE